VETTSLVVETTSLVVEATSLVVEATSLVVEATSLVVEATSLVVGATISVVAIEGVVTTAIPEWNNARVFIQCSSNNPLTTFCNKLSIIWHWHCLYFTVLPSVSSVANALCGLGEGAKCC